MNWYDRTRERARAYELARLSGWEPDVKADSPAPAWALEEASMGRYTLPDLTVVANQASLYAKLSWIHVAVSMVAQDVAVAPFEVKKLVGEDTEDILNHPFEQLLSRPNPLMSRYELLYSLAAYFKLTGNAYLWLNQSAGGGGMAPTIPPTELWVLPSQRTAPVPDGQMYISHYEFDAGLGKSIEIPAWQIVHFKSFNPLNPFVGLSPIESLAPDIKGDLAQQSYNVSFFDRDNAKADGVLAFKDPIQDAQWNRIQSDIKQEYGGKLRRSLMMLRGVGTGVDFIQTTMNRRDMQYLEGRDFTRREIYEVFAPGLGSMLSENATEANSRTGKATFAEAAVWPLMVALSEKFTNALLPVYGEALVGEFEDPRLSDRSMELQEMDRAAKVLTVEEFRADYFRKGPLGDERDQKLVAGANAPDFSGLSNNNGGGSDNGSSNRFLETGGKQGDMQENDGQPKAVAGTAEPIEVPPHPRQRMRDELDTWRRWVLNRMKAGKAPADLREFETFHLPGSMKGAIEGALEAAESAESAAAIFTQAAQDVEWMGYA